MLKTYSEAETTADGGSWVAGYNCPYIYLNVSGESEKDQGAAKIQGIVFFDEKLQENRDGLVLNFEKPLSQSTIFPQVAKQISGNKYFIPWRFVRNDFEYTNPILAHKNIKGKLQNDQGRFFDLKILLPYKYFGSYIDDSEGNKLRERINTKGSAVRGAIKVAKESINVLYPAYKIQKENILKIMNGSALIDKEVDALKKKIAKSMNENLMRIKTRNMLSIDATKINIGLMKLKSKFDMINAKRNDGNANIKAILTSNEALKNGKKNPQIEIAKAEKVSKIAFESVLLKFKVLDDQAVDRRAIISQSQKDWRYLKAPEFTKGLNSIAPN